MDYAKNILIYLIIAISSSLLALFGNDLYNNILPKSLLEYEILDYNYSDNIEIYNMKILNKGKENHKNIKIYLPIRNKGEVFINKNINFNIKTPKMIEYKKHYEYNYAQENEAYYINIDEKKPISFEKHERYYILKIKSLKSDEDLDIKFLKFNIVSTNSPLNDIKIESDSVLAENITKDPFVEGFYKTMFFIFASFFVVILIISITYDIFSTNEYKIKYLEKQIENNKKQIEKLKNK